MAKTRADRKIVTVKSHTRKGSDGKNKRVREHRRSTPN